MSSYFFKNALPYFSKNSELYGKHMPAWHSNTGSTIGVYGRTICLRNYWQKRTCLEPDSLQIVKIDEVIKKNVYYKKLL